MIEHTPSADGKTYIWIDDGIEYEGYICGECGQMIVTSATEITE